MVYVSWIDMRRLECQPVSLKCNPHVIICGVSEWGGEVEEKECEMECEHT